MIIIRDITELVKVEYARNVEKITEIMVASTSHDMRTPLNTIINMHQLIMLRETDEMVRSWIKIANNSTNQLLYLVNDTLDFFQIKSGKFQKKDAPFCLKDMV